MHSKLQRAEFLQQKRRNFYTDLIFKIEQINIVERDPSY